MATSTLFQRRSHQAVATLALLMGASAPAAQAQGRIVSWGHNGANLVSATPAGSDFIRISETYLFALGLRSDGSMEAWGYEGTSNCVSGAPNGLGFTNIGTGFFHGLAIRSDGSIAAWGMDDHGQVSTTPTGLGFTSVAAGWSFSAALHSNGSVHAWGTGPVVTNAPNTQDFTQLSAGVDHCVALRTDGSIVSWGDDQSGQVSGTPIGTGYTMVAASNNHSHALRADGSIVAWGFNSGGVVSETPLDGGYVQIAAGRYNAMALRPDGSFAIWGDEQAGVVSNAPSGTGFEQLQSGGQYHSLAIQAPSGTPYCFGDGTGASCPCGANGGPGEGCQNTTSEGATLFGAGTARLAEDTFYLSATGVPVKSFGLILRGANQLAGGLGTPVGDGLLCTGGQTSRSQVQVAGPSGTDFYSFQGNGFGASSYGIGIPTNYQFWYRDSSNPCSGAGFNFSNAWTVVWRQ